MSVILENYQEVAALIAMAMALAALGAFTFAIIRVMLIWSANFGARFQQIDHQLVSFGQTPTASYIYDQLGNLMQHVDDADDPIIKKVAGFAALKQLYEAGGVSEMAVRHELSQTAVTLIESAQELLDGKAITEAELANLFKAVSPTGNGEAQG